MKKRKVCQPGKRLPLPPEKPSHIEQYFALAIAIIDHKSVRGILDRFDTALRDHPGQKAQIRLRAYLVSLLINAMNERAGTDRAIHKTLTQLPRHLHRDLGLLDGYDTLPSYSQLNHFVRRFTKVLEGGATGLTRHDPAVRFINRFLHTSICSLDLEDHLALDWTYIETWARTHYDPSTKRFWSKDTDARMGRMPPKNGGKEKLTNVWYPQLAIAKESGAGGRLYIAAMGLAAGNENLPNSFEQVLDGAAAYNDPGTALRFTTAAVDLGYNQKKIENWAELACSRDIRWVGHLRQEGAKHQINRRAPHPSGLLTIDGDHFCPHVPETLVELPAQSKGPKKNEPPADLAARYDERAKYMATPRSRLAGKDRFECPARRGTVRCPGYQPSMSGALHKPTIEAPDPEAQCCNQRTVTIDHADTLRDHQAVPYGTTKWLKLYGQRSRAESGNSLLLGGKTDTKRSYHRAFGLTRATLAIGAACVAINLTRRFNYDP